MGKRFGRDYHWSTLVKFLQRMEDNGYVTTYRTGRFPYADAVATEKEFKEKHAREGEDFWYNENAAEFLSG